MRAERFERRRRGPTPGKVVFWPRWPFCFLKADRFDRSLFWLSLVSCSFCSICCVFATTNIPSVAVNTWCDGGRAQVKILGLLATTKNVAAEGDKAKAVGVQDLLRSFRGLRRGLSAQGVSFTHTFTFSA
jgi:hypothetical protein